MRDLNMWTPDPTRSPVSENYHQEIKTADNWSFQWGAVEKVSDLNYERDDFYGKRVFFEFIPLTFQDINRKDVIIWCGGSGREAYHIHKCGPRLLIVNDIGEGIYSVSKLLKSTSNCLFVRCDMSNNPFKSAVGDISICDHALQHVRDHVEGFRCTADVLRPGGVLAINVYSHENNWMMVKMVEPAKALLSKVPLRVLYWLSALPAFAVYIAARGLYLPLSKLCDEKTFRKIPLGEHMRFWAKSLKNFRRFHTAIFDLLHAPVSYHFKQGELTDLSRSNGVLTSKLINVHGTTWTLIGTKLPGV